MLLHAIINININYYNYYIQKRLCHHQSNDGRIIITFLNTSLSVIIITMYMYIYITTLYYNNITQHHRHLHTI